MWRRAGPASVGAGAMESVDLVQPVDTKVKGRRMAAFFVRSWPKADMSYALHMSAFGGKADMTYCGISLSRSLLG